MSGPETSSGGGSDAVPRARGKWGQSGHAEAINLGLPDPDGDGSGELSEADFIEQVKKAMKNTPKDPRRGETAEVNGSGSDSPAGESRPQFEAVLRPDVPLVGGTGALSKENKSPTVVVDHIPAQAPAPLPLASSAPVVGPRSTEVQSAIPPVHPRGTNPILAHSAPASSVSSPFYRAVPQDPRMRQSRVHPRFRRGGQSTLSGQGDSGELTGSRRNVSISGFGSSTIPPTSAGGGGIGQDALARLKRPPMVGLAAVRKQHLRPIAPAQSPERQKSILERTGLFKLVRGQLVVCWSRAAMALVGMAIVGAIGVSFAMSSDESKPNSTMNQK